MSDDDEKSIRFRVTLQPELAAILEDVRKTMGLDRHTATILAISMGLRMIDMTVVNPMRALAAMPLPVQAAIDAAAEKEVRSVAVDAGLPVT